MPASVPPQHLPAELRVQCRKPARTRDPWEEEAELLAEWLSHPEATHAPAIRPVPRDSHTWGAPIDSTTAARAHAHPGHPLDPSTRRDFESRLDRDLGKVRIHDDHAAGDLARSLGAEAFTLGHDIFTTRPDDKLLAHEIVHVVQQGAAPRHSIELPSAFDLAAGRFQASFERTPGEIDPKVTKLLDLHLAGFEDIREGVAPSDPRDLPDAPWWLNLRAIEGSGLRALTPTEREAAETAAAAGGPAVPSDLDTVVNDAITAIEGYQSSPVINALAGLLVDYLKLNDAPGQAAKVVIRFPFVRTAIPQPEVSGFLSSEEIMLGTVSLMDRIGSSAVSVMPAIWTVFKPNSATEPTWTGEIAHIVDEFLLLPPFMEEAEGEEGVARAPSYRERRLALVNRLAADLKPIDIAFDLTPGVTAFDQIDSATGLMNNELYPIASDAMETIRGRIATTLRTYAEGPIPGKSTLEEWEIEARSVAIVISQTGTEEHARQFSDRGFGKILEAAGGPFREVVGRAVRNHVDFWETSARRARSEVATEHDERLRHRLGDRTYVQLFMTEDSRSLVRTLADLAPALSRAFLAYFDLRSGEGEGAEVGPMPLPELITRHTARVGLLVTTLQQEILPEITERIYQLRRDERRRNELQRLAFFGSVLVAIDRGLRELPAGAASVGENPAQADPATLASVAAARIQHVEARRKVAEVVLEIAAAALETEFDEPDEETGTRSFQHRFRGQLARPYERLFAASRRVLLKQDTQTGVLILREPYEKTPNPELQQIIRDSSEGGSVYAIHGIEPFTANDLVVFYREFYYQRLAEELNTLSEPLEEAEEQAAQVEEGEEVSPLRGVPEGDQTWLYTQARRSIREALPQRYETENIFWEPRPGQANAEAFDALLEQDPLFIHFRLNHQPPHPDFFKDRYAPNGGSLWAWTLPDISRLAQTMRRSPFFRGLVAMPEETLNEILLAATDDAKKAEAFQRLTAVASEHAGESPANPATDFQNWFTRLRQRAERITQRLGQNPLTSAQAAEFRRENRILLEADRNRARNIAEHAMRRATTLERHAIAREIERLMEEDDDDPENTRRVLDLLQMFQRIVRPSDPREVELQVAALVLETADRILALADDPGLAVSESDLFPFISMAATRLSLGEESPDSLLRANPVADVPSTAVDESKWAYINTHSEGIAWTDEASRDDVRTLIREKLDRFATARTRLLRELENPYQWKLGISGWNTDSYSAPASEEGSDAPPSTVGSLKSHLARAFPVRTAASINARNAELEEDEQDEREPDLFMIDPGGLSIRMLRVIQPFTFLPGVGDYTGATAQEHNAHAYYVPGRVYIGTAAEDVSELPDEADVIENPRGPHTVNPEKAGNLDLVEVQALLGEREISRFIIKADDLGGPRGGLNWLASLVHSQSQSAELENLGNIIEAYGEGLMFVASIFPPTALAMTAAEVLAFVARLQSDPEFQRTLTAIWEEPEEVIENTMNAIKERFTLNGLFDLLMNGNFDASAFAQSSARGRSGGRALGGSRVAAVFRRLRKIAAAVATRLEDFQEGVQQPVRSIEATLSRSPMLSNFVEWIGDNADTFDDPVGKALRHRIIGPILMAYIAFRRYGESVEETIRNIGDPLPTIASHLQESLDKMANFKLPATIIPLEMAIPALLEAALATARRFGSKGKIVWLIGTALREGAEATGIGGRFYNELAEMLRDSPGDPNVYWRKATEENLKPKIEEVIRESAGTIAGYLREAPLIGDYFGNDRTGGAPLPSAPARLPSGEHASSAQVETSEALDAVFDSDRVNELAPQEEEERSAPPEISYSTISSLPEVFFENMTTPTKPNPPQTGGSEAGAALPSGSPSPAPAGAGEFGAPSPTGHSASAFARSGGAPLSPTLRGDAERSFGHDFSKVRLHQGPDARAATTPRGADALTSGSHIYMRPDLSPRCGRGERVFQHELAHVLQKRIPGAAPAPKSGGIRWQPSEERAADRMAERARRNRHGQPIPIEGAHRDGISPSIGTDLMETFFKKISSPGAGRSLAETVERAHERGATADANDNTRAAAGKLWSTIERKLAGEIPAEKPFANSEARTLILGHLERYLQPLYRTSGRMPSAREVISHLAARRQEDPEPRRGGRGRGRAGATDVPQEQATFDAAGFLTDLSLYITGRTGIVLDLSLRDQGTLQRLRSEASSVTDSALDEKLRVEIEHVELLFVSSTATHGGDIWKKTIEHTWNISAQAEPDSFNKHRLALRDLLIGEFGSEPSDPEQSGSAPPPASGESGSYAPMWDGSASQLKLNGTYKRKVEAFMNPATIGPAVMPNYEYYTNPEQNQLRGEYAERLRVEKNAAHYSTHGVFTTGTTYSLGRNERNSHHILQYLLGEYFTNKKSDKPFPHAEPYPGIPSGGGGTVEGFGSGSTEIKLKETEDGRGSVMPAILLSARAHQGSELHVTPIPDDMGQPSQGYAVHRIFEQKLINRTQRRSWEQAQAYLTANSSNPTALTQLHRAIQDTAEWMWLDVMKPALQDNMPREEAMFYRSQFVDSAGGGMDARFAELHPDGEPTLPQIQRAIRDRVADNILHDKLQPLRELGWYLPES